MINRITVLGLVLIISALFLTMIHQFLMAIFMAGLFSAMVAPIHHRITDLFGGRETVASIFTVIGIIMLVLVPLAILITVVVAQAISVGQAVTPWVQSFIAEPSSVSVMLAKIPYYDQILPYRDIIVQKAGQLVGTVSSFLIDSLSSFTKVTIDIVFSSIIMLYVMFYFLNMGDLLLEKILLFFPLDDRNEQRLLKRFVSVTRATIKGTVIIGIIQGTICGIAFAVVGINGPVFWGSLMAITSIIPAFGTALIWGPALILMLLKAQFANAVILLVICGAIAGNLDNLLRPRLVGKDTEMHDLFVLFGTLGGISMFGIIGIIIGPIVTALFITVWEIYSDVFMEYLPNVETKLNKRRVDRENDQKTEHSEPDSNNTPNS